MNTTVWRVLGWARFDGRNRRPVVALAALAMSVLAGCGSDDGDDDSSSNSGDTSASGSGSTPSQASKAEEFISACLNASDNECTEYLGEPANRASIEEEVKRVCRLDGNTMQANRCSSEQVVGSCRQYVKLDNVRTPFVHYYYAPLSEADGKTRCKGEYKAPTK